MEDIERKEVLDIDASKTLKTIGELKKEISSLKKELDECGEGTQEASDKAKELADKQAELTAAMKGSVDTTGKLNDSYNGLVGQMAKLKAEWRATTDEAKRKELAEQITSINDKLKDMDSSVGVFSRNVGNYQSALEAFGSKGAGAVVGGMNKIKGAADVLKAHPIITIVAVAVTVLMKIASAIKKNEEAMNKIKVALAPLQGILSVFQNALDYITNKIADLTVKLSGGLSDAISKVIKWIAKGAEALGMDGIAGALNEIDVKMKESTELAADNLKLREETRRVEKENAEWEAQIVKLQSDFKKAKGDINEQQRIANEIAETEHKIRMNNYNLAKEEYEQIKKKNEQTQSTQDDLDAENAAYVKMIKAKGELNRISEQEAQIVEKTVSATQSEENAVKSLVKSLEDWQTKQTTDTQSLEQAKEALKKKYEEQLEILQDNEEAKILLTKKYNADLLALDKKFAAQRLIELKVAAKLIAEGIDNELKDAIESNRESFNLFDGLDEQIQKSGERVLSAFANREVTEEQTTAILKALGIDEVKIKEKLDEIMQIQIIDGVSKAFSDLAQVASDLDSSFVNTFSSLSKCFGEVSAALKSGEKGFTKWGQVGAAAISAVGAMMTDLANNQDASTKEGFEKQKGFQIAAATMNMLSGIVSAWASAMQLGPIAGPIMGAILTTATATMGALQIAKIKQQTLEGNVGGSSTPSVSNAALSQITAPVQYTQDVQGASIESAITDTRVYVTESDISDTQQKVNVQENENTY